MPWIRQSPDQADTRKRLDACDAPDIAMFRGAAAHILGEQLGWRKSLELDTCMLGDERIIPMMSFSLVEYLLALDLTGMDILELGGGHSTEFWSHRARTVTTFETDPAWAEQLRRHAFPNTDIVTTTPESVAADIAGLNRPFDAIILDVSASRYACARAGLPILKAGGFMLLDNSDWYPNTSALLRQAGLIQVDFHDFRPMRWYRGASSLFLHREFQSKPRYGRLPGLTIGGKDIADANDWDKVVP